MLEGIYSMLDQSYRHTLSIRLAISGIGHLLDLMYLSILVNDTRVFFNCSSLKTRFGIIFFVLLVVIVLSEIGIQSWI